MKVLDDKSFSAPNEHDGEPVTPTGHFRLFHKRPSPKLILLFCSLVKFGLYYL